MRIDRLGVALALASGLLACKGSQVRPTALRELPTPDLDFCGKQAKGLIPGLAREDAPATVSVYLYVDADGAVPAAFIHDQKDAKAPTLWGCITDYAVSSKFEGEKVDYLRPTAIRFAGLSVNKLTQTEYPLQPLDEKLAQDTLQFAGWATSTDKGYGYYYVHKFPESIAAFREALKLKADDERALRGLASALVDSNGDLKEARALADQAVAAAPNSEAPFEALSRVCLATKDDECAYDNFEKATKAPDEKPRSVELAQLQVALKEVAERLKAGEEQKTKAAAEKAAAEAAKNADQTGCGKFPEGDDRTICYVKYCFADGAQRYALDLKPITGQDYTASGWTAGKTKSGAASVTVGIRTGGSAGKSKRGKKSAGDAASAHDAVWEVTVGDSVGMKPLTIDANNISAKYSACKK